MSLGNKNSIMPEINYVAILVAAIASMVVGGIWYGPLFGKLWMKGMGWDPSDHEHMAKMKKAAGPAYAQQFIGSLLTGYALAHMLWAFGIALPEITGAAAGFQAGFWSWVGFVLPVKYGDKLWGGKKFKYLSVDLAYYLVNLVIMAVIIAVWR
jgi:hypothetical protein